MKLKLHIIIAGLVSIVSFTSCSDWFDISPKTDVKAEELYETEYGFMSALAGIYVSMTESSTYGGNLTFGLLDQMAQMYDKVPDGASGKDAVYIYNQYTNGGYNSKGKLASIWEKEYNLIANANNLLKWLDEKGDVVITSENTANMLRGEALAIRAFAHFDLLRGWGPMNYANDISARVTKCIPYRVVADNSKQPLLPAKEVVEKIITDLKDAKDYLSYESDLNLGGYIGKERRYRFNYHAVNALLARVYAYAGDTSNALECAKSVIDHCGLSLVDDNSQDPILFDEVICGLSYYEMEENLSDYFSVGDKITTKLYCNTAGTFYNIFQTSGSESEDMRAKTAAFYRDPDEQKSITRKYIKNDNEVIPLIRLPEMYYIMCEMSELEDAAPFINKVRNKRGISSSNNESCATEELRTVALKREYCKEFYAEGQYFFFLKTRGLTGALLHAPKISLDKEEFVFPLPDGEKEYGWTEESESDTENGDSNENQQ